MNDFYRGERRLAVAMLVKMHPGLPPPDKRSLPAALFAIFLMTTLLLATSCTPEPQPVLRIGTNVRPGYEPLYLARELGYFGGDSTIKLVEYTSSSETQRAFQNNMIDGAALTLDETLQLLALGADLDVVLVMDVSHGADVILARPGTDNFKQLRNRRVGYEATALGAYMLARALQLADMTPSDIEPVALESAKHESALTSGRVDAVITFEPTRTRLLRAGTRQVFDSSQIPGEIVDVLVVRGTFAENHPALVEQVRESWFQALGYMKQSALPAAAIMAEREKIGTEEFLLALEGILFPDRAQNHRMLDGPAPTLLGPAQRLATLMVENRLIDRLPPIGPRLNRANGH
ncbi:MAG TPA: hypothetical protein DCF93_13065 [Desulfuromonas sp.]|nr:hypothetical protein [Desulfuromonas sp.]